MRVYRVEYADGQGPYTDKKNHVGNLFAGVPDDRQPSFQFDYCETHPTPEEDGFPRNVVGWGDTFDEDLKCGFVTEWALRNWFFQKANDPRLMRLLGLQISVYEVEEWDVHVGNRQALFYLDRAVRVATYSPLRYSKEIVRRTA